MKEGLIITPVIELSAVEFTDKEYPSPNGRWHEYPQGWENYWKSSIKDAGLTTLEQFITGLPLVDITCIDTDELKIIIETQQEGEKLYDEEEIIPFEGGIVIQYGDQNLHPQCCTCIGDYSEWINLIEQQPCKWTMIWVGHPWIFARIRNNNVEISDYCEQNEYDGAPKLIIDLESFRHELEIAYTKIRAFQRTVEKVLTKMGINNASRIASILVNKTM